jgi:host factor-I protein
MSKGSLNLQDSFLNQVRRESILVRITLLDGREFRGRVKGFDNFTVVVVGESHEYHLIYKHAIGQIVSPKPIHGTTSRKGGGSGSDTGGENISEGFDDPLGDGVAEAAPGVNHETEVNGPRKKSGFNQMRLENVKVRKEER